MAGFLGTGTLRLSASGGVRTPSPLPSSDDPDPAMDTYTPLLQFNENSLTPPPRAVLAPPRFDTNPYQAARRPLYQAPAGVDAPLYQAPAGVDAPLPDPGIVVLAEALSRAVASAPSDAQRRRLRLVATTPHLYGRVLRDATALIFGHVLAADAEDADTESRRAFCIALVGAYTESLATTLHTDASGAASVGAYAILHAYERCLARRAPKATRRYLFFFADLELLSGRDLAARLAPTLWRPTPHVLQWLRADVLQPHFPVPALAPPSDAVYRAATFFDNLAQSLRPAHPPSIYKYTLSAARYALAWPERELYADVDESGVVESFRAPHTRIADTGHTGALQAAFQQRVASAVGLSQRGAGLAHLPLCLVGAIHAAQTTGTLHNIDRWRLTHAVQDLAPYDIEDTVDFFRAVCPQRFETRHAEHVRGQVKNHRKKVEKNVAEGYGPLVSFSCSVLQREKHAYSDQHHYSCPYSTHNAGRREHVTRLLRFQGVVAAGSAAEKHILTAAAAGDDPTLACQRHYEALLADAQVVPPRLFHPARFAHALAARGVSTNIATTGSGNK